MATFARRARLRVLLIFTIAVTAVSLFVWILSKRTRPQPASEQNASSVTAASPGSPLRSPELQNLAPSPSPSPAEVKTEPGLTAENQQQAQNPPLTKSFVGTVKLIIPVAGVTADQLLDTFTDSRSEGRVHDAIDIMAPGGTPVLAAADGEIVKLFQSERGGTTIYQLSTDKKLIYYYAHLQSYADGIAVGKVVRQGEVIALVGDTGNAGAGNYHLHFSVLIVADPKRYWEGTNINPYPLLKGK